MPDYLRLSNWNFQLWNYWDNKNQNGHLFNLGINQYLESQENKGVKSKEMISGECLVKYCKGHMPFLE